MIRVTRFKNGEFWFDLLSRYSLVIILVGLIAGFGVSVTGFFTVNNLRAIAVNQIVTLFVALSVMIALSVGEIDLSVANVLALSQALVIGLMSFSGVGIVPAVLIGLLGATGVGLINGILVVRFGVNSLIATLAMSSVLTGVVQWYTRGTSVFSHVPRSYLRISNAAPLGIPMPIIYGIILVIGFELMFGFLPTGRRMYAIGGNRRAALLSGIRVNTLVLGSFVTAGLVAGVAGVIISSRLGSAAPDLGPSFLLPAFAAAFLGSTTIRPGRFNPLGTVVAVYVIAVTVAGIQQLGAPSWSEYVFNGIALAVGVTVSIKLVKLREARAKRSQIESFEQSAAAIKVDA
ncbi:MAG: ABC transporter permease [Acidimicrobiales bacterium]